MSQANYTTGEATIDRLEQLDPRFNYAISLRRTKEAWPGISSYPGGPILTVSQGLMSIDVFPRDFETLRIDPPKVHIEFSQSGAEKFSEMFRTGKSQTLRAGEIVAFKSNLEHLLPGTEQASDLTLWVGPGGAPQSSPARLTFGEGKDSVVFEFVELFTVRQGTEEAEIEGQLNDSCSVRFVFESCSHRIGEVTLRLSDGPHSILSLHKILSTVRSLNNSRRLEVYNLRVAKRVFSHSIRGYPMFWNSDGERLLDDLKLVADFYQFDAVASPLTPEDSQTLHVLLGLRQGVKLPTGTTSFAVIKQADTFSTLSSLLAGLASAECQSYPSFPGN